MPLSMTHDLIDLYMFIITSMTFPVIPYENNFFHNIVCFKMAIVLQVFMIALHITLISPLILTSGAPEYGRLDFNQHPDPVGAAITTCHDVKTKQFCLGKTSRIPICETMAGCVIFFPINAPGMGRFQLLNLGGLGYGLELRFWVVIAIIVSLTLTQCSA